jgi:hypothetical protein
MAQKWLKLGKASRGATANACTRISGMEIIEK